MVLSVLLVTACSRQDSVFSRAPALTLHSHASLTAVANCIASRWQDSARHLRRVQTGGIVTLKAQSFFKGVTIGVRLTRQSGETFVQYFERRVATPLYAAMVRDCAMPSGTISPEKVKRTQ
ncbi:hypothetical protein [Paraburkholderia rhizosphaerae]|nr:hypothetical protein [Paraburkholderia rhizosphaerae]